MAVTILQLDFDGTVVEGDASTGILARFAGPEWTERVDAASAALRSDPASPLLLDAMRAGFEALDGDWAEYIAFARRHHPARPGLRELIDTAGRLGIECHIVSGGFEFYIDDYLREAGVAGRVAVHAGPDYLGPDGSPMRGAFKLAWANHVMSHGPRLIYAGDGSSDIAPARLADIVFARDGLFPALSEGYAGTLRPFDTLLDIARSLDQLTSERLSP